MIKNTGKSRNYFEPVIISLLCFLRLKYKVYIGNSENDTDKGDTVLVDGPPAWLKPSFVSSVYYINVQLIDNHGYTSLPSPSYRLSTEIYLGKL